MAKVKKSRVRKSAPTMRQVVEAQAEKNEIPSVKKRPVRTAVSKLLKPLSPLFNIIKKVLRWIAPRYFVNSFREVRLVTWPSRRETWRLTGAVFIFAVVFGTIIYFVDKGLDEIFKKFVLK